MKNRGRVDDVAVDGSGKGAHRDKSADAASDGSFAIAEQVVSEAKPGLGNNVLGVENASPTWGSYADSSRRDRAASGNVVAQIRSGKCLPVQRIFHHPFAIDQHRLKLYRSGRRI